MPGTTVMIARTTIDWRATILAALIAGAVFIVLEMLLVPVFLGDSAWAPPRMIAAILLGRDVLPPPATFDFGIMMTALLVHFTLAIIYAFILALIVAHMGAGAAIIVGAVFGIALYVINFYGFTAIFPWFAMARNILSLVLHAVFGAVLGWSYKAISRS